MAFEIGSADIETSALEVLGGDAVNSLRTQDAVDLLRQGMIFGERFREKGPQPTLARVDVLGLERGVDATKLAVIFRPQEGENGHQRAGADAGYRVERRSLGRLGPADENTGLESPERAASGKDQATLVSRELRRPLAIRIRSPTRKRSRAMGSAGLSPYPLGSYNPAGSMPAATGVFWAAVL